MHTGNPNLFNLGKIRRLEIFKNPGQARMDGKDVAMLTRDAEHNAEVRARVARVVKDKGTAEKLSPWYPTWCKRPTFSDIYLDTYNRENVHLVDTSGKGVESATAKVLWRVGKNIPLIF
ncbi:hypothetical protein SCARD494_14198 [Seiridium cardinale]